MNPLDSDCFRSLSSHERAALMDVAKAHAMQLRRQAFEDAAAAVVCRGRRIWRVLFARTARSSGSVLPFA
jgi:hypothetical protein